MKHTGKHYISEKIKGHFQYNDVVIKIISRKGELHD